MKMLVAKLAQMVNCCLTKSDAMLPMAQMATGNISLACTCKYILYIYNNIIYYIYIYIHTYIVNAKSE